MASSSEKCYDPQDRTLTFVDGEDEMDFLCIDYKSLRAKMSCGHAVTPMSLTEWCRRLLDEERCSFVCGQTKCDAEWSFEEVCKMALLTPEEVEEFEKKRFSNAAQHYLGIKACPGCKCLVARRDFSDLSVTCTVCTAKNKSTYMFCWQCLKAWKGLYPRSDRCDNDGCESPLLDILRTCPDVVLNNVNGVKGCPSTRACPTCGMLVRHDGTKCKNIGCTRCKVEFCFVCLKITEECLELNPGSWFDVCSTGVAPRQTSIPVRQRRSNTVISRNTNTPSTSLPRPTSTPVRQRRSNTVISRNTNTPYMSLPRQTSIPVWQRVFNTVISIIKLLMLLALIIVIIAIIIGVFIKGKNRA